MYRTAAFQLFWGGCIELVDRRCAAVLVLAYIRGQFICQTAPEIELNNLLLLVGSTVMSPGCFSYYRDLF
jgi:hypothetical protein